MASSGTAWLGRVRPAEFGVWHRKGSRTLTGCMIHVIDNRATPRQLAEMLEELKTYIKLAVDVRREVLAGGGALHADCEAALLEDGSQQADVWGADWIPATQQVKFESLINIRPKRGNRSMTIEDADLRESVEAIVKQRVGSA